MKKIMKSKKGITLISLVVTIIILLILAGISIGMLSGDNSILKQAGNAKSQTDIAEEKEILQTASLAAMGKSKYGDITKEKLDSELNNYSEIQNTEQVDAGIVVTFKSGRVYLIDLDGNVSRYSEITIGDLVVKNGNTVVADGSKSVALNTVLTINFTASIPEGSIASISPTLPYTTNGTETSKTFTITGTGGETKTYTVNLKGYYNIPDLKVGDFVNYTLKTPTAKELEDLNNDIATYSGATDNTEKTAVGDTLLCRVLEMDNNGNPTKLISANGVNTLSLNGANGYNNAVYLINEICTTLYSGNQGTTRSLTIEDLENNYFSNVAIATRNNYTSNVKYGETRYYAGNNTYPNITLEEANMGIATTLVDGKNQIRTGGLGLSEQTTTYTGNETTNKGITVTQTSYRVDAGDNNYKNATLNNIIHQSPTSSSNTASCKTYWLASRCVETAYMNCTFNIRYVNSSYVSSQHMGSNNSTVRPVITLDSGIQAEYGEKYNDTYNTWNLQ